MRTAHLVASAAWIGGSIFYAWVVLPQIRRSEESRKLSPAFASSFARVVSASGWTLLATGGYLTFDRLTNTRLAVPYALVLLVKVLLAAWMLLLAGALGRRRTRRRVLPEATGVPSWLGVIPVPTLILALGLLVFVLSAVLTTMYAATPSAPPISPG